MDRLTVEQMSRIVPYSAAEVEYVRRRPPAERTPLPSEGDMAYCRLDEWGPVWESTVERVQPLDDVDDPHLYRVVTDGVGELVILEGRPVISMVEDPWVTLWLSVDTGERIVRTHTREARLRGSAGWLPLDWKTRKRWLPTQLEMMVN